MQLTHRDQLTKQQPAKAFDKQTAKALNTIQRLN